MNGLTSGRWNLSIGLLGLASFMVYGFVLIYLRDFAPGAEQWAADYGIGTHFETRLAHVHGALFSLLNVIMGVVVSKLHVSDGAKAGIAGLSIAGLLMPIGILAEVLLGAPPVLVLVGAIAILLSFGWAGLAALKSPAVA